MTNNNTPSASQQPSQTPNQLLMTFLPAAFTLAGVLLTTAATWFTGYQATAVSEKRSCIERLDNREASLRSKGEAFLSALAEFNYAATMEHIDWREMKSQAHEISKSGYILSAHAPSPLNATTINLTLSLTKFIGTDDAETVKREADLISSLIRTWTQQYTRTGENYEKARSGC